MRESVGSDREKLVMASSDDSQPIMRMVNRSTCRSSKFGGIVGDSRLVMKLVRHRSADDDAS